jgi:ribosomal-protein-alanine N-acetyltransferase
LSRDENSRRDPMPSDLHATLSTDRLILRRWRDSDREPFARLNADPEVMRHFLRPLTRAESDAFVDRIEARFDERGFGLWAVERREDAAFLGFTGLAYQDFEAHFTPCVEVGWRFDRFAWGHGYATEAAREALRLGFGPAGLAEIVSLTSRLNVPSMRVMERIGMHRDPADDFDYPNIPAGHPLRRHVVYRLRREEAPHDRSGARSCRRKPDGGDRQAGRRTRWSRASGSGSDGRIPPGRCRVRAARWQRVELQVAS